MRATPLTWITRVLWLALPVTTGELLGEALAGRSTPVVVTAAALAWGVWVAGLLATLVALPVTLTLLRVLAPLPLVAGIAALVEGARPGWAGWAGLATAAAVAACPMSAEVGDWFVNGSSYGDERRLPLRPPAALLVGPVELVWAVTVLPVPVGALLLAARSWVAGAVLVALGVPVAWWGFRTLERLARRWVVLVPAGVTLVDDLALAEPVLFRREDVARLGPAPVDTDARDLTVGAAGLVVEIRLARPVELVPAVRRGGVAQPVEVEAVLVAPGRPGATLAHAEAHHLQVARG